MFSSLKEKLKGWVKKVTTSSDESKKQEDNKKTTKKTKKKQDKKPSKKSTKKTVETKKQEIIEVKEKEDKQKPKFSLFKKHLTEEKFDELFTELELILMQNNVAIDVIDKIKSSLEEKLVGESLNNINLEEELKKTIEEILIEPKDFINEIKETIEARKSSKEKKPFVILFAGINGSGKTTTIAKIANLLKKNKLSVCLAAADTFRAAAIQQLEEHANRLNIPVIKKDYGSDPASVGFDAISYAKKHNINVVLIDTAGRMQNRDSLMKEMEKITRVNNPDMKIFLGESITGNDATEQARAFNEIMDLTGIILSKADIDEKGGTALSVSYITKKPILFLGVGQSYDDLEPFKKEKIIKNLGL